MCRLFLLILYAASCHSQDSSQDIDIPPSDCCGVHLASDDLGKGGATTINQFPWLAIMESPKIWFVCVGSLITSRHVLTSAQCDCIALRSSCQEIVRVKVGKFNFTHPGPDCVTVEGKQICNDGAITMDIAAKICHPEFQQPGHDIAVIKLANKVPYNDFIRPICLPTSDFLVSLPDNLRFINAGWGTRHISTHEYDYVKRYVSLPYIDLKICQEIYRNITWSQYKIVDSQVCAGGEKDLDTCINDGGGPLMLKEKAHYTVVAISRFGGIISGIEGVPSVYTKVYPHLSWINSVISENELLFLKKYLNLYFFLLVFSMIFVWMLAYKIKYIVLISIYIFEDVQNLLSQ